MTLPYNVLSLIRRGESVVEGVPNRVFFQIDANVRHLADLLDATSAGAAVFARGVTVEADAAVGMPVFFDPADVRFERGLAATVTEAGTGLLVPAPSAGVWGVVFSKAGATLADLLVYGYAPLDLAAAVDGEVAAGVYYLSPTTPGKLTRARPALAVPVLRADGQGNVVVCPAVVDFLDRHVHYHFSLHALPAGDTSPPAPGGRHEITSPDAALPGWLPAGHASFGGHAPAGASFGYNLAAHPALQAAWPPLPAGNAQLVWDKGLSKDVGGTAVPLGADGLCVIDRYGIWWLSDCAGDVPWPADFNTGSLSSYSDSAGAECPRHLQMALDLWFTRVNFATDVTAVTSLHSADPRLKVYCYNTTSPASTGDLVLVLDLALSVVGSDALGGLVLKELQGGNLFTRGWVAEGLYAVSDNVVLASEHQRRLTPGDEDSPLLHQGPVGISVLPQSTLELPVDLYRLDGADQEYLFDLMYLGLPADQQTAVRGKVKVPDASGLQDPVLALRLRLLGRAAGSLPQLTVTARRVPRNDPGDALDLPTSAEEFAVTVDTTDALADANQYVEATSDAFAVADGDLLFFTVQREDGDGYNAEVGILSIVGILTQG